ncbi:uncharacterized protein [Pyrus communis]|uniref:uncharacterized protein n=1 Tax=Pyrus communis TaxID=23211 RepID=UPI0035C1E880
MMHSLLQTDLRFGVIYNDAVSGTADVGCVGEVVKHERLVDDRFFLICKGQERFRVTDLVRTKPYLVAEVQWLKDRPSNDGEEDLEALASEVESYMKDVIRLSNRLGGKPEKDVQDLRRNLFPTPFSFFVGSTFEGAPREQQALLELEDTAVRLKREKDPWTPERGEEEGGSGGLTGGEEEATAYGCAKQQIARSERLQRELKGGAVASAFVFGENLWKLEDNIETRMLNALMEL